MRHNFGLSSHPWSSHYPSLANLPSDRVINMFIIGGLQIGTIYAKTFSQFLAVRALFGIGMYFIPLLGV